MSMYKCWLWNSCPFCPVITVLVFQVAALPEPSSSASLSQSPSNISSTSDAEMYDVKNYGSGDLVGNGSGRHWDLLQMLNMNKPHSKYHIDPATGKKFKKKLTDKSADVEVDSVPKISASQVVNQQPYTPTSPIPASISAINNTWNTTSRSSSVKAEGDNIFSPNPSIIGLFSNFSSTVDPIAQSNATVVAVTTTPLPFDYYSKMAVAASTSVDIKAATPVDGATSFDVASITGITLGIIGISCLLGAVSFVMYRRRFLNKPQALNDKSSTLDSSGYIDEASLRENSEEMYSLDNDSFLNSLEAMTIQNYWTENVKHTKL